MKVLQVARYGSVKGGLETYVASLCDGLRTAGHDVALACAQDADPERPEVRAGSFISLDDPATLDAAIYAFSPDVVHVHLADVPWVAPTAAARAPTLLAVHDHVVDCPVGTRYWTAWKRACAIRPGPWCLAYNVVAHCGSLRANATLRPYRSWRAVRAAARGHQLQVFSDDMQAYLTRAGLDPQRVAVTPYPVPPPPTAVAPDDDDRRPVVLASGRLNKEKGFLQLIEAMEYLTTEVHLVIAGDGHARPALERRARMVGRRHRITFTGWVSAGLLAGWRARAAVVAVPSMWPEPFGIVGLEAMAAGRPVVAFDTGGIGEWLVDGETGRLVRPGDVRAFADALRGSLQDEEMRERMGAAAGARAAAFALGTHVERVLGIYEQARAR